MTAAKSYRSARRNNSLLGLPSFPMGITVRDGTPLWGWIERHRLARHSDADTPFLGHGAVLYAYGKPRSAVFAQRGIQAALTLGVLTKPNRSRVAVGLKTSPNK